MWEICTQFYCRVTIWFRSVAAHDNLLNSILKFTIYEFLVTVYSCDAFHILINGKFQTEIYTRHQDAYTDGVFWCATRMYAKSGDAKNEQLFCKRNRSKAKKKWYIEMVSMTPIGDVRMRMELNEMWWQEWKQRKLIFFLCFSASFNDALVSILSTVDETDFISFRLFFSRFKTLPTFRKEMHCR